MEGRLGLGNFLSGSTFLSEIERKHGRKLDGGKMSKLLPTFPPFLLFIIRHNRN